MAGRKRKVGKRTKSGRLSRAKVPPVLYDRGTEAAQAVRAIYGTDCTDAIGRAYRAGLLGDEQEAKPLLDTARSIASAYWQAYEVGPVRSAIGARTFGNVAQIDHERVKKREEWLEACLRFVDGMGANVRRSFDQLVIDPNPDAGPAWLDTLCWSVRIKTPLPLKDKARLREALDALEQLTQ